ncbi:HEPN domain-containing protein [Methylosinus sp. LW4]|uniref:HEPN domain-containing protein n=1 Tax=Methylosinus sp. LW4 TaxID=136993 RepID=UPI000369A40A|nr:HEPN domain-containing protein [Methylosinus sp. LW4]
MKAEAAHLLEKAREDLSDARKIAAIGLVKVAARCAYYAAFHAAEAYIMEATGKSVKTHSGARAEFARLAKDSGAIDKSLPKFLAKAYIYKEISDYGAGPGADVTPADAEEAIIAATRFIDSITALLARE